MAGFIDADGGFKIRFTKKAVDATTGKVTKQRIALMFVIEQRKHHPKTNESFESLMRSIADSLLVNLTTSQHNNREYWCVTVTSLKQLDKLIEYLNMHSL